MSGLTLKGQCPQCKAAITLPLMRAATEIRVRTCHKCHTRWQVKTTPLPCKTLGLMMHELSFTAL